MSIVCPSCDTAPPANAAAGAPCTACGTALVDMAKLEVVGLEERTNAPPRIVRVPAPPVIVEDAPLAALPPEIDTPLELDPTWVAERAAKQAVAANPPKPKRQIAGVVIAVLLIAVAIAAIVWFVKHR